jgi:hypothetical protein
MIMITTVNKGGGNVSSEVAGYETHMQALEALARDAKASGHSLDAIMLAVRQPFIGEARMKMANIAPGYASFPEKKKYADTFHFNPKSEEDVMDFYKEFKGLISDDMYDAKIKHVLLYNIQMKLPA